MAMFIRVAHQNEEELKSEKGGQRRSLALIAAE